MKLYSTGISPYARHCQIALRQSDFVWQQVDADVAKSTTVSPCQRIPYFKDESIFLTDSASIIRYVREKCDQAFCKNALDYDLFCMATTVLDSAMGLMVFEREGLTGTKSEYLQREGNRVTTGLSALNANVSQPQSLTDGLIRVGCLLEWGLYRERFTLALYPRLQAFLAYAKTFPEFEETSPFTA